MAMHEVLVSVALAAAVVGCTAAESGKAVGRTTTTTITTTPVWRPPPAGTYVPVAEIPPPSALRDNVTFMWTVFAQQCREYDFTHGTATKITVLNVPELPDGWPVSDTACIPPPEAVPGGGARAL